MNIKYLLMGVSLILLLFVAAELSADRLYIWTDKKGILHISEDPPPKMPRPWM
jgi:acetylglutamate kinase